MGMLKTPAIALLFGCFGGFLNMAVATPSLADEALLLDRWYQALAVADREEIAALLADGATIELKDIGVTQSRADFTGGMDEWADAIAGGTIQHRMEATSAGRVTALVCYRFTDNAMLTRESFALSATQIVSSVQETIAAHCDAF
jgi:hypothetical protein